MMYYLSAKKYIIWAAWSDEKKFFPLLYVSAMNAVSFKYKTVIPQDNFFKKSLRGIKWNILLLSI